MKPVNFLLSFSRRPWSEGPGSVAVSGDFHFRFQVFIVWHGITWRYCHKVKQLNLSQAPIRRRVKIGDYVRAVESCDWFTTISGRFHCIELYIYRDMSVYMYGCVRPIYIHRLALFTSV